MNLLRELAGQTFIRFIIENFYTKDVKLNYKRGLFPEYSIGLFSIIAFAYFLTEG